MKKLLCICLLVLSACSAVKAANQPESKDLSVLKLYNTRMQLIAEFGAPATTEINPQGLKIDTFSFVNGYNTAARSARAMGHGLADVASLGLWEVVGTPIEGEFNGSKVNGQAVYDKNDRIIKLDFYEEGRPLTTQIAPEYDAVMFQQPVAVAPAPVQQQPVVPAQ